VDEGEERFITISLNDFFALSKESKSSRMFATEEIQSIKKENPAK